MSGFYSPYSNGGSAGEQIGNSLRQLTQTMAQKQMMQRYQQQQLALRQQDIMNRNALLQAQVGQQHAATQNQSAQAGFNEARTQHQQGVDSAAQDYQRSVVARSDGLGFMQNGPTIADAERMNLSRELGARALVRALGGNVDNAPTATINPGQERINTMTGESMGYLPPNPSFHSVPAGATPYIINNGEASQSGPQTRFRPTASQQVRQIPIGLPSVLENMTKFGDTNDLAMAQQVMRSLASGYTNQNAELPARSVNTIPGNSAIDINTFGSEDEARQSGHKAGDVIYLKGVGKVQLN